MRGSETTSPEPADGQVDRRQLLGAQELAVFLGVPLSTVYAWSHRRLGPRVHKVGRHLRYRWIDVESWLEEQAVDRAA